MSCGIDCGWSRPGSTPSPNSSQNRNALLISRVPASVRQRLLTLSPARARQSQTTGLPHPGLFEFWVGRALFDQHFEDSVHAVLVELDGEFGPILIRQVVELAAGGDRQQENLGAFVDGQFHHLRGVGEDFHGTA